MSRRLPLWTESLQVFFLSALAIAQPLFDLLGRNATFFVTHQARGIDLLLFAGVLLFAPPLLIIAVRAAVGAWSARAGRAVHAAAIGFLAALIVTPPVVHATDIGSITAVMLAAFIGVGAAVAYMRVTALSRLLVLLSPLALIFPLLFLVFSPAHDLVQFESIDTEGTATSRPMPKDIPVVVVLFDELPLSSLVTPDGWIDRGRYPNLARLARTATWYREATTVALRTDQAVPALLTGRRPLRPELPSFQTHPQNLFTFLRPSHELHVREFVTQLCPIEECEGSPHITRGWAPLLADTGVVYLHIVTPPDAAARVLPPLGERWGGFIRDEGVGERDPVGAWLLHAIEDRDPEHEGRVVQEFIEGLTPRTENPLLTYLHLQLPHPPWRYLPGGQTYESADEVPGYRNYVWGSDQYLVDEVRQRHLLQTRYADLLLGRLMDAFERRGLLDDAMFVVVSDHGAGWTAGSLRRAATAPDQANVLNIPLLVKYPAQKEGKTNDGSAQTVDILPTIADVLGVEVPWEVDGQSLLNEEREKDHLIFDGEREREVEVTFSDVLSRAAEIEKMFGRGGGEDDLFAFGPHRKLLGDRVDSADRSDRPITLSFDAQRFRDVNISGASLPVFFRADLEGPAVAGEPAAVALNGRIAGVGQTFEEDGKVGIAMILSPRYLRNGRNEVSVVWINDGSVGDVIPSSDRK